MLLECTLLIFLATNPQEKVEDETSNAAITTTEDTTSSEHVSASSVMVEPNQYPSMTTPVPVPGGTRYFYGDWPFGSDGITGDWGGVRSDLESNGIYLQGSYSAILMDNFTGGANTGFYGAGTTELMLTLDMEELIGLKGGTFFLDYAYANWFNSRFEPSGSYIGSGSPIGVDGNLLPDDEPTLSQIAQLYWSQSLFDDVLDITFGKIDANAVFCSISAAGGFQYSTASYPSTLNPFFPSYPQEATGLQMTLDVTDRLNTSFGWFDGTSAAFDPRTGIIGPSTGPRGPSTFFNNAGHWFFINQWNLDWSIDPTRPGNVGVGGWLQSGTTATSGDSTTGVDDPWGLYLQAEQTLWAPDEANASKGGGIQVFGGMGWSQASRNPVEWSCIGGVSATGVIPNRPADALGIMGSASFFSDDPAVYLSTRADGMPGPSGGTETAIELFYKIQVTPSTYIQPGLQWIGTPGGGDPAPLDDSVQGYLIINVVF